MKERRLIKYRQTVAAGSNLDKRLDSLGMALKELESRLLSGRTPPLAAVEIQKIVQEIAEKSHVQIRSVKVLNPLELEQKKYLSIPVEFHIYLTLRQLKEVLYLIETSSKFLTVIKVRIMELSNVGRQFQCYITVAGLTRRAES
ncbi:MAG: GspMb/PilO family protein [Pseudomonadota bacterium]